MPRMPAIPNTGRHIREYPKAAAATFVEGRRLALTAGEVATTTGDVLGFALHDSGADPDPSVVLVAVAKADSTFWVQGTRAPLLTDEGKVFDFVEDADGITIIETAAPAATPAPSMVTVEKVDLARNMYEIRVNDLSRQITGGV